MWIALWIHCCLLERIWKIHRTQVGRVQANIKGITQKTGRPAAWKIDEALKTKIKKVWSKTKKESFITHHKQQTCVSFTRELLKYRLLGCATWNDRRAVACLSLPAVMVFDRGSCIMDATAQEGCESSVPPSDLLILLHFISDLWPGIFLWDDLRDCELTEVTHSLQQTFFV